MVVFRFIQRRYFLRLAVRLLYHLGTSLCTNGTCVLVAGNSVICMEATSVSRLWDRAEEGLREHREARPTAQRIRRRTAPRARRMMAPSVHRPAPPGVWPAGIGLTVIRSAINPGTKVAASKHNPVVASTSTGGCTKKVLTLNLRRARRPQKLRTSAVFLRGQSPWLPV